MCTCSTSRMEAAVLLCLGAVCLFPLTEVTDTIILIPWAASSADTGQHGVDATD